MLRKGEEIYIKSRNESSDMSDGFWKSFPLTYQNLLKETRVYPAR